MDIDYHKKYLKYKNKYYNLLNKLGGSSNTKAKKKVKTTGQSKSKVIQKPACNDGKNCNKNLSNEEKEKLKNKENCRKEGFRSCEARNMYKKKDYLIRKLYRDCKENANKKENKDDAKKECKRIYKESIKIISQKYTI